MDPTLMIAAAGMRSRLETLEVVANNIANLNTAGFKADREFYNLFLGLESEPTAQGESAWMPVLEGSKIDMRQGVLAATGAPLDVGLSGPGFLVVDGPQGLLYTRSGNFHRSPTGRLETTDGFAVRGVRGPIMLPMNEEVRISEDGWVGTTSGPIDRLQVVEFAAGAPLTKVAHAFFRPGDSGSVRPATRTGVRQGYLEAANVNPAEAAVRLIEVHRQFETLARAVTLVSQDMNRRAIDEIPRAGS
jgi:flagellar basal body rod protein FlgG